MRQMKKILTNSVSIIAFSNQINIKFISFQDQHAEILNRLKSYHLKSVTDPTFKWLAERSTIP